MVEQAASSASWKYTSQGLMMHRTAWASPLKSVFSLIWHRIILDQMSMQVLKNMRHARGCCSVSADLALQILMMNIFHMVLDGHTCELETIGFSEAADYRASNMELIGRPGYLGVKYHVSGKLDMDVEIDIPVVSACTILWWPLRYVSISKFPRMI